MFKKFFHTYYPFFVIIALVVIFFYPLAKGLLPIPSDTIIGLYHPFRDLYANEYPRGIPFKNSLITDPVRQQYPWRDLAISQIKQFSLPLWNPYSFSGTPLLGNMQSAPFYPLNIVFLLLPFSIAWSFLIVLQMLLGGIFIYFYLRNLSIEKSSSIFGAIVFMFCGFSISWLEWNTILQTGLWLPLILLCIDKVFYSFQESLRFKTLPRRQAGQNSKLQLKTQKYIWAFLFIFSLISSFFAGHLQIFFYVILVSFIYFAARWWQYGRPKKVFMLYATSYLILIVLAAVQWIPTLQFILLSARNIDQLDWQKPGWFIPWEHLIQFIVPDFFGNPTTLNYWGVWNYGELVGYVGILPLIFATFAMFFRHDRKTLFFGALFFLSLIFALPTYVSALPFVFQIPFLSTAQPTRLMFIIDFSLSILAAFGLDHTMRSKKSILIPLIVILLVFLGIWMFLLLGNSVVQLIALENAQVANRNLLFSSIIYTISAALIILLLINKLKRYATLLIITIILFSAYDLLRFGQKFTPFTNPQYLFPKTETIEFLKKNVGNYRIMSVDSRILPPNFSVIYRLQDVAGYDPLFLKSYAELIAASERGKPDISPPFGFNRIITPHNYDSKIIDLLGVKYVLSLTDLDSPKLKKVFQEGETRVYENKQVLPRAFFVKELITAKSNQEQMDQLFANKDNLSTVAVVADPQNNLGNKKFSVGTAKIISYRSDKIIIETENAKEGFLVFTDIYYPTWKTTQLLYKTNYSFRGIVVPPGKHEIVFSDTLF